MNYLFPVGVQPRWIFWVQKPTISKTCTCPSYVFMVLVVINTILTLKCNLDIFFAKRSGLMSCVFLSLLISKVSPYWTWKASYQLPPDSIQCILVSSLWNQTLKKEPDSSFSNRTVTMLSMFEKTDNPLVLGGCHGNLLWHPPKKRLMFLSETYQMSATFL